MRQRKTNAPFFAYIRRLKYVSVLYHIFLPHRFITFLGLRHFSTSSYFHRTDSRTVGRVNECGDGAEFCLSTSHRRMLSQLGILAQDNVCARNLLTSSYFTLAKVPSGRFNSKAETMAWAESRHVVDGKVPWGEEWNKFNEQSQTVMLDVLLWVDQLELCMLIHCKVFKKIIIVSSFVVCFKTFFLDVRPELHTALKKMFFHAIMQ